MAGATLVDLPTEVLCTILLSLGVGDFPGVLAALRLTCRAWCDTLAGRDDLWEATGDALRADDAVRCHLSERRRSKRLRLSVLQGFSKAVAGMLSRTETVHHTIACLGQDKKRVTVSAVRRTAARWAPIYVNRVSPVYDATILMEVCRARGCTDLAIAHAVAVVMDELGADARAGNCDGLSPLIIASGRGMPRTVALLLAHGADPLAVGTARFRITGGGWVRGRRNALQWAEHILEQEAKAHADAQPISVAGEARAPRWQADLRVTHALLLEHICPADGRA